MTDTVRRPEGPVARAGEDIAPPAAPAHGRHPGDALRIALGATVVAVAMLAVQRDRLSTFEGDLFRLVNDLPSQLSPVPVVVIQAAALGAGTVTVLVARRHRRAALDVVVAGTVAWSAAGAVADVVRRPRPTGLLTDVQRFDGLGLGFVSGPAAVAAAIVAAAGPYLPRRWRRLAWTLPWAVGIAQVYEGAHLPLDVVGGVALGWAVGATVHLTLGAPRPVPGVDEAAAVLRRAGIGTSDVRPVPGAHRGSFPFVATVGGRRLFVKLLDPEPRDRDLLYRAARFLAVRDVRDETALLAPSDQAHREAAMLLLVAAQGARVPAVLGIEHDRDRVWLVEDDLGGADLGRLPTGSVTDEVLRGTWDQLARIHEAGVAHRDLVASNVVVDDDGLVWIVDLGQATSGAPVRLLDNDVAELLATTTLLVGPERAVAAAVAVLGRPAVARALPELHALALTAETRRRLRASPDGLRRLRQQVAVGTGIDLALVEPFRIRSGLYPVATLVSAIGAVAGLVIVAGPAEVGAALTSPGPRWLGLAVVALAAAEVSRAGGIVAALDRRLAIGRTVVARLSALSAAVLAGRRAGRDELVGYLERSGVPRADGRLGLRTAHRARLVVGSLASAAALWAHWRQDVELSLPDHLAWLLLLGAAAGAVQVATGRPQWTRPTDDGDRPSPRSVDLAVLAVAATAEMLARVVVTVAATAAMGAGAPIAGVVLTHLVCNGLAGRGPSAGAPGTGEVVMTIGLAAFGAPLAPAVAAALASRALLVWVPVAVGLLVRRGPLRRRLAP